MDGLIPKPSKFILLLQREKGKKIERAEPVLGEGEEARRNYTEFYL